MIDSLTPEQEQILVKWRDDGLRRGLKPDPVDPTKVRPTITRLCRSILQWKKDPVNVILEPSPRAAWQQVNKIVSPNEKLAFQGPYLDGHFSSFYFAWVRCWKELGVTGIPAEFDIYAETEQFGPIYPLVEHDTVVVSDTTRAIHLVDGRLHCGSGPAVHYEDNFDVWALHGVRVPKVIVVTNPEDMDKPWLQQHFIGQKNVEIRKEILMKVGPDRLLGILGGKVVDKAGDYELIQLDIGDGVMHPFLRMKNPSTDVSHVESVARACRTVAEALNFRNGLTPQQIDDEKGAKWFQQGDVLLFPHGERIFKSKPEILR